MIEAATQASVFKTNTEMELISKVEGVLETLGYELRDLEIQKKLVRITLDNQKENIGIEDCEKVHHVLNPLFDMWDPLQNSYTLEVSSPGEKAPLRLLKHFEEALGSEIKFQTRDAIPMPAPLKPRRNWSGKLEALRAETLELVIKDSYGEHRVHIPDVVRATWNRNWTVKDPQKEKQRYGSQ